MKPWKLDLHVHSEASFDGCMTVQQIAALAKARGIDGVAICDHDIVYTGPTEVDGVLIIPGAEFSTEHGHLLGLFLTAPIQYTTWEETVRAIHDQGGLTVLAHPYQNKDSGSLAPFRPILDDLDAIETWNSRAARKNPKANDYAFIMALMKEKPTTGGSDAHVPQEVGRGFLTVEVEEPTLEAIKAAIRSGKKPEGGHYWGHGTASPARYVAQSQLTKLRKTHAGVGRYAKWGLFAANCLRQDVGRTLRTLKDKLPARPPKELRDLEKQEESDDLWDLFQGGRRP